MGYSVLSVSESSTLSPQGGLTQQDHMIANYTIFHRINRPHHFLQLYILQVSFQLHASGLLYVY
jgi:hypothetical protein